jgi:hypothetical protein
MGEVSPTPIDRYECCHSTDRISSSNLQKSMCIAQDATFELMDALKLTRTAQSLADLSLSCVFRRQWSSVYEALQDTRPDREQLMKLYIAQIPSSERIVLAGDSRVLVETICQNPSGTHLHERITSWDSPIAKAVQQLSSVSSHLPSRAISLWDSEYGCAPFINQTAFLPVDKLMRLRSNLYLWGTQQCL